MVQESGKIGRHADDSAGKDEKQGGEMDGGQGKSRCSTGYGKQDKTVQAVLLFPYACRHLYSCGKNQVDDACLDTLECILHIGKVQKCIEIQGNKVYDKKRGDAYRQCGDKGAPKTGSPIADVGGAVNGDRSRRGFGNRRHVIKIVFRNPALPGDKFFF